MSVQPRGGKAALAWLLVLVVLIQDVAVGTPLVEPPKPRRTMEDLTKEEENCIRSYVYDERNLGTAFPREGPYALMTVLYVPKDVQEIYARKKKATLRLLAAIVERANPVESILAAACAYALVESPAFGGGMARCPPDVYDEIIEGLGVAHRDHVILGMRDLLEKVEKAEKAEKAEKK
jgi:hypothetical protein